MIKFKPYYRKAPSHERLNQLRAENEQRDNDYVGNILFEAAKNVVMRADAPFLDRNGYLVTVDDYNALVAAVRLVEKKIGKNENSS